MKANLVATVTIILLFGAVCLSIRFAVVRGHDPRDLSYWGQVGATQTWATAAARGDSQAQFFYGFALVRTNIVTMIDRVPRLSEIPVIGKRYFEVVSYQLNNSIDQDQMKEGWIKLSADQGFAPAAEAEKLLLGRIAVPNQLDPTNRNQPSSSQPSAQSATADSDR